MVLPLLGLAAAGISAFAGSRASSRAASAQENAGNQQYKLGQDQLTESRRQFDATTALQERLRDENLALAEQTRRRNLGYAGDFRDGALAGSQAAYDASLGAAGQTRNALLGIAGDTYGRQTSYLDPYSDPTAQNALNYELGLGDMPSNYRGYEATPGFQFALEQAQSAVDGSAAASGNLFSGATIRAQQDRATGLAQQDYGNHLARLTGQAGAARGVAGLQSQIAGNYGASQAAAEGAYGSTAINAANLRGANTTNALANYSNIATGANNAFGAGATGANNNFGNAFAGASQALQAGQQSSNQFIGNALANIGDARASGAVGQANALTGGINNAFGILNYQNQINQNTGNAARQVAQGWFN